MPKMVALLTIIMVDYNIITHRSNSVNDFEKYLCKKYNVLMT